MPPNTVRTKLLVLGIVAVSLLSACAGNIPAAPRDQRAATDPWEPLNRRIGNFNDGLDNVTLKPLAKGYRVIVPGFARKGI